MGNIRSETKKSIAMLHADTNPRITERTTTTGALGSLSNARRCLRTSSEQIYTGNSNSQMDWQGYNFKVIVKIMRWNWFCLNHPARLESIPSVVCTSRRQPINYRQCNMRCCWTETTPPVPNVIVSIFARCRNGSRHSMWRHPKQIRQHHMCFSIYEPDDSSGGMFIQMQLWAGNAAMEYECIGAAEASQTT